MVFWNIFFRTIMKLRQGSPRDGTGQKRFCRILTKF